MSVCCFKVSSAILDQGPGWQKKTFAQILMLRICAHASCHYDFERAEIGEFGLQQTISKSAKRSAVHNLRNMT